MANVGHAAAERPHSFHIPVMGIGFSIDTPLRVAKYGISSAISMVDDVLVEQMRKLHAEKHGEPYEAIEDCEEDARARRFTAYLDLLDRLVARQVEALQASAFEPGSEITRYFELLPDSPLKRAYTEMLATADPAEKARMQDELRPRAVPGTIDVNIMTKLDRETYRDGEKLPVEFREAMSALRGFANSTVQSSVVLSVGLNRHLYAYLKEFDGFFPDEAGVLRKKIILKVSDLRSAAIQGRFLAKQGLWVSEYRIESGLSCGGHAFPTKGYLMGPILEEFKASRKELVADLFSIYAKALAKTGRQISEPLDLRITVQCGISNAAEDDLMLEYYGVDGTGWGTPFLLVPEVTNVDEDTLAKLVAAKDGDVYLSEVSPLSLPFWLLRNSAAVEERQRRVAEGKVGAECATKRYAQANTEFTDDPICISSRAYVRRKLKHLEEEGLSEEQINEIREEVLGRACLCHELGGSVTQMHNLLPTAEAIVCPGPNITDFDKVTTLEQMVGHIYGRVSVLTGTDHPHAFLREARIYVEYLQNEFRRFTIGLSARTPDYLQEFKENVLSGLEYYAGLAERLVDGQTESFLRKLEGLRDELECICLAAV